MFGTGGELLHELYKLRCDDGKPNINANPICATNLRYSKNIS